MIVPKIKSAKALGDFTLEILFDNDQKRTYDVKPLLSRETFTPLKSAAFFKSVQVEPGGYAVVWNSDIDICEYELWRHGK